MTRKLFLLCLMTLVTALGGCRERTDQSEGSVILSVSDFNGLPSSVSVASGPFLIEEVTVRNIPKQPSGQTSDLQSIELRGYEVTYRRRDTGRRVPPPYFQSLFGLIPVGGNSVYENIPILTPNQILNPPLEDLGEAGVDSETGSQIVVLDVSLRFFGRTLAGDDIVSDPATFTIQVTP